MDSILDSIRARMVPVRREGLPFVAVLVFVAVFLGWFWQPFFWVGLILAAWCAYFFRDPRRVTPIDPALVISPADGRVATVATAAPPGELNLDGQGWRRVSIFMSLFDCHVNRAPLAGIVKRIVYTPGKFLNAELDKASVDNERNAIVLDTDRGPVAVVQIAGLVARRIVCFAKEGDGLVVGERLGLIRFGSRVDLYLPASANVVVAEGQTAVAGETVIARFGSDAAETRVRID